MKIIKRVDISNWSHKHKCIHCDSELELDNKDIQYIYIAGDQREMTSGYQKFYANCAVCSNEFTIPTNLIPKALQINVEKRQSTASSAAAYYYK
ncbi:hypothetical protein UFOVP1290_415 [uncultured Caudovirales phage]|uniref:Uncharacterized protein n=1 Tax=uncultured Caudovirales phage TaxID=2100421 RepID=A0A6J5RXB9_9CAUD|nr:hypothetical protein UFOVP1290_415 [uncultured Caudovirales phage]